MITVTIDEKEYQVKKGIRLEDIAKKYGVCAKGEIVLAYVNRHLSELHKTIEEPAVIEFVSTVDKIGLTTRD